ncbi:LysR family transcriptional regulator [Sphingomonas sp. GCM10030256]|uniref:LysR family transcriptional regulator n=1 Tax=Sphingomonas sp. GCM10030256 TaxID=3273427 RepID=UPI00360BFFA3
MTDWNDWRYFLAVARTGSTLAAGRELRVSQTTVARRIAALEEALGLTLFERRQAGYALTDAGASLVASAQALAAAAEGAEQKAGSLAREAKGTVRLTTDDLLAAGLLGPMLRELHELHPEIRIELDTSLAVRDLGAGEADIAIRSIGEEVGGGLAGRRICSDEWTVYCSRDYAAAHGAPRTREDLRNHAIVGGGGGNLWRAYRLWLQGLGLEEQVAMHHDSPVGLLTGVRSGFGISVLPCIIADADPELIRCYPPRAVEGRSLWLLTHERVRHLPPVRLVLDFLYERLGDHVRRLQTASTAA